MRDRDHLEDPGIDGMILLKCIFRKCDGVGGGMDRIDLPQNRERWEVIVNTVMNLLV
jgi:hypothetical protein